LRLGLAVAIVVAALAGCGGNGDGDDTAGSPPTEGTTVAQGQTSTTTTTSGGHGGALSRNPVKDPRAAVEAVLASGDPGNACAKYVTDHYLSVAYGGRLGCIQAQSPASAADRLDFKSVRVDGDRATGVVVPSGGPYDGERVIVSLVRDGRRWAVDELNANVPVGP
jgi:hypothetical protein